ncbi:MAG: FtsX-like permease family protein [Desulfovibrio sp.]|jgi:putative ABC transport system permease protein|nr:FtsX-like permease family protein [Desulfovibrio sp.]
MRTLAAICRLSIADYCHERLLSICAILSLAAVLAPLLVLYGVKFGVVETLTTRLRNDPRTLEISTVGSGKYGEDYLQQLAKHPLIAFVQPRTRNIAATMDLVARREAEAKPRVGAPESGTEPVVTLPVAPKDILPPSPDEGPRDGTTVKCTVSLEPTAPGDPLLERYGIVPPRMPKTPSSTPIDIVVSASAAEKLGLATGKTLEGRLERTYRGRVESAWVTLRVAGVLPLAAQQKDTAYVPLPLMEACEYFRDGRAATDLGAAQGWVGDPPPTGPREYPSFRCYARNLTDVEELRAAFEESKIEVYTHAEDIEQVLQLSETLTLIFLLICSAAAAGFIASTVSATLATVKRKQRILGLLRLTGFSTFALTLFPLLQALATTVLGTMLATGIYAGVSSIVNRLFGANFRPGESVCTLPPEHLLLAFGIVAACSLAAALIPALQAARIEPSEVIRDV